MAVIDAMFESGLVLMGPSRTDPSRQVATFDAAALKALAVARNTELQTFLWILGEWTYENDVPAGRLNPAYTDAGLSTYVRSADGAWICAALPDGREMPLLTFDAWSRQWIYVLTHGAYGVLRSPGWTDDSIVFTGVMTMVGVTCDWRMTWSKTGRDTFAFVNEERTPAGDWMYVDTWRHVRQHSRQVGQ